MISIHELATIYETHRDTMLQYLTGTLHQDPATAEDVYHSAIIKFFPIYGRTRKPLNLLVEICKNLITDRYRRIQRDLVNLPQLPGPQVVDYEQELIQAERERRIRLVLTTLKGRSYTIVRLFLAGYTVAEIARQTGTPRDRVYTILRKAHKWLVMELASTLE
jgi:RNA polymerase sigma factor (sigma-70 family)